MISYAQNFEDVILERFFKEKTYGFYVDVGAADPIVDSVTKHFYDKGWRGINIEPSPYLYKKLVDHRKDDINLNCAVTETEGIVTIYDIWNSGLSTTIEDNAQSIGAGSGQHDYDGKVVADVQEIECVSRRLDSIFNEYVKEKNIDFLKIDVEGAEKNVLESNNWNHYRPYVLIIESTVPNSQMQNHDVWGNILLSAKYIFVYFDGLNRFYLRNDLKEKQNFFSNPPNVFDGFVRYKEVLYNTEAEQARAEAEQARAEAEQARAEANFHRARANVLRLSRSFRFGFYVLHPWKIPGRLFSKVFDLFGREQNKNKETA